MYIIYTSETRMDGSRDCTQQHVIDVDNMRVVLCGLLQKFKKKKL